MTNADDAKKVVRSTLSNPDTLIKDCVVDDCEANFIGVTAVDYAEHISEQHQSELPDGDLTNGIMVTVLECVARARRAAEEGRTHETNQQGGSETFWSHPGDIDV
jgi:hypothetical protein